MEFRCTDEDLVAFRRAAGHEPLSSWARRMLREAAGVKGAPTEADLVDAVNEVVDALRNPRRVGSVPGVTVASRLRANFCERTGLERSECLCPGCKGR